MFIVKKISTDETLSEHTKSIDADAQKQRFIESDIDENDLEIVELIETVDTPEEPE